MPAENLRAMTERRRVAELVAIPHGWRAIVAHEHYREGIDPATLPDDRLFDERPIPCVALVEYRWARHSYGDEQGDEPITGWERHTNIRIEPVVVDEGCSFEVASVDGSVIAILAPDEPAPDWLRDEAIHQARQHQRAVENLRAEREAAQA